MGKNRGNLTAKLFISSWDNELTKQISCLSKKQCSVLIQIVTGHCHLAKHMHKVGLVSSPICTQCYEASETVEHFLCSCSAYILARGDVFERDLLTVDMLQCIDPKLILRFIDISGRFGEC